MTSDSGTAEDGTYRLSDYRIRVEENPAEDDYFSDMLRIRKGTLEKFETLDGDGVDERWVEGTLANIPKDDGHAILEALADFYGCEVRGR